MIEPISVYKLAKHVEDLLTNDFLLSDVMVEGEISRFVQRSNGQIFFDLVDDNASISCTIFANSVHYVVGNKKISDGSKVVVKGKLTFYKKSGRLSFNVFKLEEAGKGDIHARLEELTRKLSAEGLFDKEHKKAIPRFPKCIGILTADESAAFHDIMSIIQRKNKHVSITLFPVKVQGVSAAVDICKMLDFVNNNYADKLDYIILGRGGGSKEDLWVFNDEALVRSIFKSDIPVVTAIGHEIDYTLSDMVADYRAETPTAAANMIYDSEELKDFMNECIDRGANILQAKLKEYDESIKQLKDIMNISISGALSKRTNEVEILWKQAETMHPYKILEKGYSMVLDETGRVISSYKNLDKNKEVKLVLNDGAAKARIIDAEPNEI